MVRRRVSRMVVCCLAEKGTAATAYHAYRTSRGFLWVEKHSFVLSASTVAQRKATDASTNLIALLTSPPFVPLTSKRYGERRGIGFACVETRFHMLLMAAVMILLFPVEIGRFSPASESSTSSRRDLSTTGSTTRSSRGGESRSTSIAETFGSRGAAIPEHGDGLGDVDCEN